MRKENGNINSGMEKLPSKWKKKKKAWCGQVYMDIKLPKREEIFEMVKCTLHIGGIKREV